MNREEFYKNIIDYEFEEIMGGLLGLKLELVCLLSHLIKKDFPEYPIKLNKERAKILGLELRTYMRYKNELIKFNFIDNDAKPKYQEIINTINAMRVTKMSHLQRGVSDKNVTQGVSIQCGASVKIVTHGESINAMRVTKMSHEECQLTLCECQNCHSEIAESASGTSESSSLITSTSSNKTTSTSENSSSSFKSIIIPDNMNQLGFSLDVLGQLTQLKDKNYSIEYIQQTLEYYSFDIASGKLKNVKDHVKYYMKSMRSSGYKPSRDYKSPDVIQREKKIAEDKKRQLSEERKRSLQEKKLLEQEEIRVGMLFEKWDDSLSEDDKQKFGLLGNPNLRPAFFNTRSDDFKKSMRKLYFHNNIYKKGVFYVDCKKQVEQTFK